jgi:PmbA protein
MSKTEAEFLSEARPLAENLIDYAKKSTAYGVTDAKVTISVSDNHQISVENGDVAKSVSGVSYSVSVTLYAGDRTLSFSRNTMDEKELREAMLQNMKVLSIVPPNPNKKLLEPEKVFKGTPADLDLYDKNPPTNEQLFEYAKEVEKAALAEKGVKGTRSVGVSAGTSHMLVMATNGLDYHESRTRYSASASVVAEDASGMQIDGDGSTARHFNDMAKPAALGKQSAAAALSKLGATLPNTGTMPIVLSQDAAEDFFSSVYSAIDGTALNRGTTFLKGKLGQQVMSDAVTIVDDPMMPRGLASGQVDSAGMESKPITYVEKGVLKAFNATLMESRQLGIEPTGRENGPTNGTVMPGNVSPDGLMADIKDGIYIEGFNGGRVDVNNGLHSRQAHGHLIKDGKVTDIAVSGFVVSGNLKDMFMNIALANDTPPSPSTRHQLCAPTTRINGVTIAGK